MMNQITLKDSIYNIITLYPQAQQVLVTLGFKPMGNTATVNTVGRVTTLEVACAHLGLDYQKVVDAFKEIDLEVIV